MARQIYTADSLMVTVSVARREERVAPLNGAIKKRNGNHYINAMKKIWSLNNGAVYSELCSSWVSQRQSKQGIQLSGMWEDMAGLATWSTSWGQPVQLSDGTLEGWESNGNINLDRRISDGGGECCMKTGMCNSAKRCHERKSNVNHYIKSR